MSDPTEPRVFLVGAGPGDPGLLTLRAAELLARADLVLYDQLIPRRVLDLANPTAECLCVRDLPGQHPDKYPHIHARLIEAARAGKTVVRLKGGDPFVFGRGSEEAAALREAGIEFEVVPGITAAVAASAYAGISLTHRRFASAVAFVTGHEDPSKPGSSLDFANLAAFAGTLVFYMGLHRLPQIAESLIAAGKAPATPACVVSRGTTPRQRIVAAPLADLPARVAAADLHAPSLIVVGECVTQREAIAWFEHRPLLGLRIGLTRPEGQLDPQIGRCLELGADPVPMPTIRIGPPGDWRTVDAMLGRLGEFDWLVFTSANGVAGLFGRLWETSGDLRRIGSARIATIGPGTADALAGWHLRADLVPEEFRAEGLAAALVPHVAGKRVLWVRANRGRDVLPRELEAAGATLETVVVYENEDVAAFAPAVVGQLERGEIDWIGLSSPSIARHLATLLPAAARERLGTTLRLASISPVTTAAATEAGLPVAAEATTYTWDGIFEAIRSRVAIERVTAE
jgi:uroporphyrinogen III methyltransferase / synthase